MTSTDPDLSTPTTAKATPPAPPDPAETGRTAPRPTEGVWTQLRPLVLRLHFYAGVFVAPFLAVAALTGLAYVFSPQLSDALYSQQLYTTSRDAPARPLEEQIAAATAAVSSGAPEASLATVTVPDDPARTTEVTFDVPGLAEDWQRTAYIDPSTATVRGVLDTWFGYPPLQATLDGLHRHLLLGEPGRLYSEAAASWLWVLVLGGLGLWWVRRRRGARSGLSSVVLPPRGSAPAGSGCAAGMPPSASGWPSGSSSCRPPA